MDLSPDPKRIDRVVSACVQCRSRHVKCDATQPVCKRCSRDGKTECVYQKSRRGGLTKEALARRKMRIRAETSRDDSLMDDALTFNNDDDNDNDNSSSINQGQTLATTTITAPSEPSALVFQVSAARLLDLFYTHFWPSFPIVLPQPHLLTRLQTYPFPTLSLLLLPTLHWIGSIYAPWTPSTPYFTAAHLALSSPLPTSPFTVQALMLFAIAQHHSDQRVEARGVLNRAVEMALALGMNLRAFARDWGEGDSVLEEAWRRTYFLLVVSDQHFSIVANQPLYALLTVRNEVDLPCDDGGFEVGDIPPPATWAEYQNREFADVEVVYSSIVYLYDMAMVVAHVMNMFLETGSFSEHIIDSCDMKLAIWMSLLPACKKDPLRRDGTVDEVMFTAHMVAAITISTIHRPCSSLAYTPAELTTSSFQSPSPFVLPSKAGRAAHTARALKAVEMQTKLLAIPCAVEHHNVFTMCISAQLAAVQISACNRLLEDHALSIARDRVRLSIGFLNAMGSLWPLGKKMAWEVKGIARAGLMSVQNMETAAATATGTPDLLDFGAEIEMLRDELIWPIDPSAQIDIYSGLVLPMTWDTENFGYASSGSSSLT